MNTAIKGSIKWTVDASGSVVAVTKNTSTVKHAAVVRAQVGK